MFEHFQILHKKASLMFVPLFSELNGKTENLIFFCDILYVFGGFPVSFDYITTITFKGRLYSAVPKNC